MLRREARQQMKALKQGMEPRPFTYLCFGTIVAQWADWKRGIMPNRAGGGRGSQNPNLLLAFEALDAAEGDVKRDG